MLYLLLDEAPGKKARFSRGNLPEVITFPCVDRFRGDRPTSTSENRQVERVVVVFQALELPVHRFSPKAPVRSVENTARLGLLLDISFQCFPIGPPSRVLD